MKQESKTWKANKCVQSMTDQYILIVWPSSQEISHVLTGMTKSTCERQLAPKMSEIELMQCNDVKSSLYCIFSRNPEW